MGRLLLSLQKLASGKFEFQQEYIHIKRVTHLDQVRPQKHQLQIIWTSKELRSFLACPQRNHENWDSPPMIRYWEKLKRQILCRLSTANIAKSNFSHLQILTLKTRERHEEMNIALRATSLKASFQFIKRCRSRCWKLARLKKKEKN